MARPHERRLELPWCVLRASRITICALFGLTFASAARADSATCVAAAEDGQRAQKAGHLRVASENFSECSAEVCPKSVRDDCTKWRAEVQAQSPTIVIDAKGSDGHDVSDVTVSVDGVEVAKTLDGRHRRDRARIDDDLGIENRAIIGFQVRPVGKRIGRIATPLNVRERHRIGRNNPAYSRKLGRHVAERLPRFDIERRHRIARKFHDITAAPAGTVPREQCQDHVLGGHTRLQSSRKCHPHRFRARHSQRPRRHRMFGLARPDAPGERAERPLRAGVTIRRDQCHARQHDTEFRRNDMRDPLIGVIDVEQRDPRVVTRRARLGDERAPPRHRRRVAAPGSRIDDMVHHREHPRRIGDRTPRRRHAFQRRRAGALVQEHPVDGDQGVSTAQIGHDMRVPNFIEECALSQPSSPPRPRASRASPAFPESRCAFPATRF